MRKGKFVVGLDVGKDELWVAIPDRRSRQFRHSRQGVASLVRWLERYSSEAPIHICMEATGVYSTSVAIMLTKQHSLEVSVVNPAAVKAFGQSQLRRCKTDQVDAQIILAFAIAHQPAPWQPEAPQQRTLYHLVNEFDSLQKIKQQMTNRDHAQAYCDDLPRQVRQTQRQLVAHLAKQMARIEKAIKELLQREPDLAAQMAILTSCPGIATLSASRILAYGGRCLTTYSRKALTAQAGLAPRHHRSGSSVRGKSRLAKQGNQRLRAALYMPALVAAHHNPSIKPFYQRLLNNGKSKKLALTACMKKLLLLNRAMLINQKTFNPDILTLT